jgi:hypothetical protein
MAGQIIVCKRAGTTLFDADGIATSQTIAAGGAAFAIDGALIVNGKYENPGWGHKVTVKGSGSNTGKDVILAGKFFESTSVGAYIETITVAMSGSATVASAEYAVEITGARMTTSSAGSIIIGLDSVTLGAPVTLNHGSLYQAKYGGTFGGATVQVKGYDALNAQWSPFGTETGETAATIKNYEIPAGSVVRAELTNGSSTTAIGVSFEIINKQK